ncbi:hypothetical protein [Amphritea pacifica]|uniref:ATP-grasp domain-containing protein n=1 Tax=Amphritea pacifica TaxID=2811233 RepID=A0ABS2W5S6_9GAMM|nr:hypothetical protein [Amphritea pacifica]MBN0987064.1 hypothetical protein [Amphritea pacifica]
MNHLNKKLALLEADPHAYFIALALEDRSIEWHINTTNTDSEPLHWLCFKINGQDLVYRKSIFFEPGKGRWNDTGKKINQQAQLIVADKHATKTLLRKQGINTPRGEKFRRRDLQKALSYYKQLSGLICVKPNSGNRGRCVTSAISSYERYEQAIHAVADEFVHIVAEEHVEGEHFRFFYVEPEVIGVRRGVPLSVVGDGQCTIAELLEQKNRERRKRALITHPEVAIDNKIIEYLKAQNLTIESVLPSGERVFLRSSAGYPEGADTILLDKDEVHPDYLNIVARACQSVPGLHFSGVDIVIRDVTQPATDNNYWILELNSDPAFIPFYYPWKGKVVDVAGLTIDMMIERFPFR